MEKERMIRYEFRFPDRSILAFEILLDGNTCQNISPRTNNPPEWTRLEYKQCENCPLSAEEVPFCPPAHDLVSILRSFSEIVSYEHVIVRVHTPERIYEKDTTVQTGLSSLIGLVMAASECPILRLFRPMVRTHLPFATPVETLIRMISSYLFAHLFIDDGHEKQSLEQMNAFLHEVQRVNLGFSERLKSVIQKDSGLNALIVLDSLSRIASFYIEIGELESLKPYYEPIIEWIKQGNAKEA